MAKFSAQGRVKSLFTGDEMTIKLDSKMGCGNGGVLLRFADAFSVPLLMSSRACRRSTRLNSSSFSRNKSNQLNANNSAELVESKDRVLDEIFGDGPEFENDDLSFYRGLVLDISYRPINVVCWKRSICLEFMEKADVLEYYDQTVSSPSGSFYIPAVLRVPHLLQVVRRRRVKKSLSRKNIIWRDNFTCQYCSSGECLTIDHILPITRGGEWTWENLVTACARCNSTKGNMTPEEANMKLLKVPKAPKDFDIVAIPLSTTAIKILRARKGTPEEWQQYLSNPFP